MANLLELAKLPSIRVPSPDFDFIGIGGLGGGGIAIPPFGGTISVPIVSPPLGPGGTSTKPNLVNDTGLLGGTASNLVSCLLSPSTCLLRLVLLIIGLICIIGAIYLYKPTSEIIAAPARAAHGAARDAIVGLAA